MRCDDININAFYDPFPHYSEWALEQHTADISARSTNLHVNMDCALLN